MTEEYLRRKSTEFSKNTLSEYMEVYRDAALRLINDAEEQDKELVQQVVTEHLQTVRDDIGQILNGTVSFEDLKDSRFPDPKISEIDIHANLEISDLIVEVYNKINDLMPKDDYDAEIITSAFILPGILKSITKMRTKVRKETAKPLRKMGLRKKTLDSFEPKVRDWLREIQSKPLHEAKYLDLCEIMKLLKKYFNIDSNKNIQREIGLEESVPNVNQRSEEQIEQYKINDGIKLHNWILKKCVELARQEEHSLLSYIARIF